MEKHLMEQGYAVRSINSMLASMNSLLDFLGWCDYKVKSIRLQRRTCCTEEKELTKAEYLRLLDASKRNEQLNLMLQTICGTGIRVSELRYFTVEALRHGEITVNCKSKTPPPLFGQVIHSNRVLPGFFITGGIFPGCSRNTPAGHPQSIVKSM